MATRIYKDENQAKLREFIAEDQIGGWEKAWTTQTTPWEAGNTQPPLEELFKGDEVEFPKAGRALVPGCGKGYDAVTIAKNLGLQVTAMDISPTAIALANENLKGYPSPAPNVSFEKRDFFSLGDEPTFELVSDYTFFQALNPTLRAAWGAKMSNIVRPGGFLVVLAFPTDAPKDIGPPFGINEGTHSSFLGDGWVKVLDRVPSSSSETHVGRDRLFVFQKKQH